MRTVSVVPALLALWPGIAWAWPDAAAPWQALRRGGAVLDDVAGDQGLAAQVDLWGTADAEAGAWSADADSLYLRLRLDNDPALSVVPGNVWAFLLDSAPAPGVAIDADWEHQILVSSVGGEVQVWRNAADTVGVSPPFADQVLVGPPGGGSWGNVAGGAVRVVAHAASASWTIEVDLDRDDLITQGVIDDTLALRVALATGSGFIAARDDVAGCDDTNDCLVLSALLSDAFAIDADEDGLTLPQEAVFETDPGDADTDDDGVRDGDEAAFASDGGGSAARDCDSDGDRILDGTEAGLVTPDPDTDTTAGCWVPDADPLTTTDPYQADTDGGGIPDGVEDLDRNGRIDAACWETDPEDDADDVDTDGDGIADVLEARTPDGVIDDVDSDGDGISDAIEGLADDDGDCLPAFLDDDSDGDGIPDVIEGGGDTDGDGVPDSLDPDADGDGMDDVDEGTDDADCDGIPDWIDADDYDGICDEPIIDTGVLPDDDDDGPDPEVGWYTGGACSTLPASGALWSLAALGALLVRRRRALLVAVALPAVASAQEVNAQRFDPAPDSLRFLVLEDPSIRYSARFGGGVLVNWADAPFVYRTEDGETDILGSVVTTDLLGFWNTGYGRLGVDLPLHVYTQGYEIDGPVHLGDLRLSYKLPLDALMVELPVDLAPFVEVTLPTGDAKAYVGDARFGAHLGVAGAYDVVEWFGVAANVGVRTGQGTSVGSLDLDPAMTWRTGVSFQIPKRLVWLGAELDGEVLFGNAGHPGTAPVELLGSVQTLLMGDLRLALGVGTGLTSGVGAPDVRVVGGLSWWAPRPMKPDVVWTDMPEPPSLGDPEPAVEDPVATRARLVVRAIDPGGRPIPGAEVRLLGDIGVPLKTGQDGILEAHLAPAPYEVTVAAPGWVAETRHVELSLDDPAELVVMLQPEEVTINREVGQIYLNRKVFFELESAVLKVDSLLTLDRLVVLLLAHPELERVRIEGHTDTQGSESYNLKLSKERAKAVRDYLIENGVAADRLVSEGLGESRPLQPGETEDVHATNRRVEFHIVEEGGRH